MMQLARIYQGRYDPDDDEVYREPAFGKPISYYLDQAVDTRNLANHLIRNQDELNALMATCPDRMHHVFDPGRGIRWHYEQNKPLLDHMCNSSVYWQKFVLCGRLSTTAYYKHENRMLKEYLAACDKSDIEFYIVVPPSSLFYFGSFHEEFNSLFERVKRQKIHGLIMRLHNCIQDLVETQLMTFQYGKKKWHFSLPMVTERICRLVDTYTVGNGPFSPHALDSRERDNGHSALSAPPHHFVPCPTMNRVSNWHDQLVLDHHGDHRQTFRYQYNLIKELYNAALNRSLNPLRADWLQVIAARCDIKDCWAYNPHKCRECSKKMAQAAIVVFCAQGVADANILPYLGAVFRHVRYANWTIAEWARISVYELATILQPCSAQAKKALYLVNFFKYVHEEKPLQTVKGFSCIYGLGKKSACLLLLATTGHPVGIPVDRHLQSAFINLRWVPQDETDCTVMSRMVECWLPKKHWSEINDEIAGIRQLYRDIDTRKTLLQVAKSLTFEHQEILNILVADMRVSANKANPPRDWMLWGVWGGNADLPIIPPEVVGRHILRFL